MEGQHSFGGKTENTSEKGKETIKKLQSESTIKTLSPDNRTVAMNSIEYDGKK